MSMMRRTFDYVPHQVSGELEKTVLAHGYYIAGHHVNDSSEQALLPSMENRGRWRLPSFGQTAGCQSIISSVSKIHG